MASGDQRAVTVCSRVYNLGRRPACTRTGRGRSAPPQPPPVPSGRPQRLCARAAPRALLGAVTAALATPPRGGELPAGRAEAGQSAGPRPRPQGRGRGLRPAGAAYITAGAGSAPASRAGSRRPLRRPLYNRHPGGEAPHSQWPPDDGAGSCCAPRPPSVVTGTASPTATIAMPGYSSDRDRG